MQIHCIFKKKQTASHLNIKKKFSKEASFIQAFIPMLVFHFNLIYYCH